MRYGFNFRFSAIILFLFLFSIDLNAQASKTNAVQSVPLTSFSKINKTNFNIQEYVQKRSLTILPSNHERIIVSKELCASPKCQRELVLPDLNRLQKVRLGAKAQKALQQGKEFYRKGEYDRALLAFQRSIKLRPSALGYFGLGECLAMQEKSAEALKAYRQAVKLYSKFDEAHFNIGLLNFEQKSFQEALQSLRQSINLPPVQADEYFYAGLTLRELNRHEEAIQNLQEAVKKDDKFIDAYENLGDLYLLTNRQSEAIAAFERVIELNPQNARAFLELGILYFNQKKYAEARRAYQQIISIQPKNAAAYAYLADADYILRDYAQAAGNYEKAFSLQSDLKTDRFLLTRAGYADLLTGKQTRAVDCFSRATALDVKNETALFGMASANLQISPPNYAAAVDSLVKAADFARKGGEDVYFALAFAHLNNTSSQGKDAVDAAKKFIQLNPQSVNGYLLLGAAQLKADWFNDAFNSYKQATVLAPLNPAVRMQTCNGFIGSKRYFEATSECQTALKFAAETDKPELYLSLASAHLNLKNWGGATAACQLALQQKADFAPAYIMLGAIYQNTKKWKLAVQNYQKAASLDPKSGEAYYALGVLYSTKKKKKEALQQLVALQSIDPQLADQLNSRIQKPKK